MKMSIRLSIISLFTGLLALVSLLIIASNYYLFNDILLKAAKNSLTHIAERIVQQTRNYLSPLDDRVSISADIIQKKIITPDISPKFTQYLLRMIKDNPDIYGAYWADTAGNFYFVERYQTNLFLSENTLRSVGAPGSYQTLLTSDGEPVGATKKLPVTFDPRVRPWFLSTEKSHHLTRTLYLFHAFGQEKPVMGITAAAPVYTNGSLDGIFGMDMTLSSISHYFLNQKFSRNSLVFMSNDQEVLLASSDLSDETPERYVQKKLMTINQLTTPWAVASYRYYQQHKESLFSFRYNHKNYIAAYVVLPTLSKEQWQVCIVIPELDLIQSLHEITLLAIFCTFIILLFGFLLIGSLSNKIAQPIVRLTKESEEIQRFNLESPITKPSSFIKEINRMQNAFNCMKAGLKSFRRYVPISLVKKLIESGIEAQIGGEEKELTFMFVDIDNFTSIAEHLNPTVLMQYLSDFFEVVDQVIKKHKGTLDKFLGDGAMAFWNAPTKDPDHAIHTCNCALDLQATLATFNQKTKNRDYPDLHIHMGINTGHSVVGNVGATERLNYTAISDAVNVTARLLSLNKIYHSHCIVGQATYELVKNAFEFRLLDIITVRGRTKATSLYELLGAKGSTHFATTKEYQSLFTLAFANYQKGYWKEAILQFEQLKEKFPEDTLPDHYIARCKELQLLAPKNWDGIWVMRKE